MTTPAERKAMGIQNQIFDLLDELYILQGLTCGAMVICGHMGALDTSTLVSMRYIPGKVDPEKLFEGLGHDVKVVYMQDTPTLTIVPKE